MTETQQAAQQRDLEGNAAARGVRIVKTRSQRAELTTEHFQVNLGRGKLDQIEAADNPAQRVKDMVSPRKDVWVIPSGAAEAEIPRLVAAVLEELELEQTDEASVVLQEGELDGAVRREGWSLGELEAKG